MLRSRTCKVALVAVLISARPSTEHMIPRDAALSLCPASERPAQEVPRSVLASRACVLAALALVLMSRPGSRTLMENVLS